MRTGKEKEGAMKLQLHDDGRVEFRCDCCDRILDESDPGQAYFKDYEWFLNHLEEAGPDSCWFLCAKCFADHHGEEQPWYDDRWRTQI